MSETEKLADINPVHRHAWDIAIQMGIVLYLEGEIVSCVGGWVCMCVVVGLSV